MVTALPVGKTQETNRLSVSVIIPHYNGVETLRECLESLLFSSRDDLTKLSLEIVVVDNASPDGSSQWVKSHYPQITLLQCDKNYGYAGGCNRGANLAKGDYLLFLNNDTVHEPGWITPLVQILELSPEIAAVQPKILNYYDRKLFDYAGGSGGEMDILCFPFTRGRLFLTQERDSGQYDNVTQIFWASGTAFLVRKDLFEKAGRFDETFFAHQEEIDFCWRLHLLDYKVAVNPASVIYHKNALTLPTRSFRKKYLNHRNSLLMFLANYNLPALVYLFPIRLALELFAVVYAVALRDLNHVRAIFQSLFWILFHPGTITRKRKFVRGIRKLKDREVFSYFYRGSIVWEYYLLGKRYCSELLSKAS